MGARLLADENVPGLAAAALRQHAHDVLWMHEEAPGTADPDRMLEIQRDRGRQDALDKLRKIRRSLPSGFVFERDDAHAR